nr:uncharacterized protein LOC112292230 [Physcomitrium patens]|eukprot:XP_024396278.1 uncharacterized protein LOC112292230 [Physcomitrella patens]
MKRVLENDTTSCKNPLSSSYFECQTCSFTYRFSPALQPCGMLCTSPACLTLWMGISQLIARVDYSPFGSSVTMWTIGSIHEINTNLQFHGSITLHKTVIRMTGGGGGGGVDMRTVVESALTQA